jgi:PhnB protein
MQIQPCEQAVGTRRTMLLRNREAPEAPPPGRLPAGGEDKVMHAEFVVGDTTVMLSDGRCSGMPQFDGFSLSIGAADEATSRRLHSARSDGGRITMPLGGTFWSPCFGMVTDRFGVGWMVSVPPA